jgi:ribonuclease HI
MGYTTHPHPSKNLICWVDGACDNNSQKKVMGLGAVIAENTYPASTVLAKLAKNGGESGTSNIAEYEALCMGLEWVLSCFKEGGKYREVIICMDSQLVLNQVKNTKRISSPTLRPFNIRAQNLMKELRQYCEVTLHWIPRINNEPADELSKIGLSLPLGEFKNVLEKNLEKN